ncbi:MAG TPA: hypothetical protein PK593_10490 [Thermomicrobiales bacterium]|jgi:hypothetical protein|nr:hypothetical protein [Chloroflexota bacterium]HCG30731.1 hypothetical protein [Chloroflexota bacterium]HQX63872.1 hypothetical protein [Thermomicrobiales bacterium]HQZ88802.1 hypothetical protein [Thermomicrobiales bacterium]
MRYVTLGLLVLLAACGGNSSDAYYDDLGEIMTTVSTSANTLVRLIGDVEARPALASTSDWQRDMGQVADTLVGARDRLRRMTPPAEASSMHTSALRAIECLADGVGKLRDGYQSNDRLAVMSASQLLADCSDLWGDAKRELDAMPR